MFGPKTGYFDWPNTYPNIDSVNVVKNGVHVISQDAEILFLRWINVLYSVVS